MPDQWQALVPAAEVFSRTTVTALDFPAIGLEERDYLQWRRICTWLTKFMPLCGPKYYVGARCGSEPSRGFEKGRDLKWCVKWFGVCFHWILKVWVTIFLGFHFTYLYYEIIWITVNIIRKCLTLYGSDLIFIDIYCSSFWMAISLWGCCYFMAATLKEPLL